MPRRIAEHRDNAQFPDLADGVWAAVEVDADRFDGRAEKVNITLPRRLLSRIDEYAKARGATRSGFIADVARKAMG